LGKPANRSETPYVVSYNDSLALLDKPASVEEYLANNLGARITLLVSAIKVSHHQHGLPLPAICARPSPATSNTLAPHPPATVPRSSAAEHLCFQYSIVHDAVAACPYGPE
jgi:hypothetical protein